MGEETVFLIIHGHFYQPPRENPWLGLVERQPGAYPFHDWNERIASECYTPNTMSRLLDSKGRIDDIVNNFEYLSFNVGPTLFQWLEKYAPSTYAKIIRADEVSRQRNGGHGSAIAQPYNHEILPLAPERRQRLQIRWGLADFRKRFGRPAEGMWLPETALNARTLRILIEEGIRFTILAPQQARRVRPIGSLTWQEVTGSIDTSRPYRAFIKGTDGKPDASKYLDILFFHGALSQSISFQHLLTNADTCVERLAGVAKSRREPQVLLLATDGETFGHHEPFADMCLAYLFRNLVSKYHFTVTNPAAYLEISPPQFEVELQDGPGGEGTSWSCPHGVGRWTRDCGCSTDGGSHWNQKWRGPLRQALEGLKEEIDRAFEKEARRFTTDPWRLLEDYFEVIYDHRSETARAFVERVQAGGLEGKDRTFLLELLEAEHSSALMFASCGWFFSDISRIEPIQNLRNACHAAWLLGPLIGPRERERFVSMLAQAESNVPELENGRRIYELLVEPTIYDSLKVAASHAVKVLLVGDEGVRGLPHFLVEEKARESIEGKFPSCAGLVEVQNFPILDVGLYGCFARRLSLSDVKCHVKKVHDKREYQEILRVLRKSNQSTWSQVIGGETFGWEGIVSPVAESIMVHLGAETCEALEKEFEHLHAKYRDFFDVYLATGLALPAELRAVIRSSLSMLLVKEFNRNRRKWTRDAFTGARALLEEGKKFSVELDKAELRKMIEEDLFGEGQAFQGTLSPTHLQRASVMLQVAESLGVGVRKDTLENLVLDALEEKVVSEARGLADPKKDIESYENIRKILRGSEDLNISPRRYILLLQEFEEKAFGHTRKENTSRHGDSPEER